MKPLFVYKNVAKSQLEELFTYEPKLKSLILLDKPFTVRIMPDIYQCFVHTVISQQLSSAAVDTIWNKLLFSFKKIDPKTLSKATTEQLNAIGLSPQKISLIKKISYDIIDKKLNFDKMTKWSYEEIFNKLTPYKYIGK
jgi:DNA-3-methyladenine glycosylase II